MELSSKNRFHEAVFTAYYLITDKERLAAFAVSYPFIHFYPTIL